MKWTEDEELVFNPSTFNNPMFVNGLPEGTVVSLVAGRGADPEFLVGRGAVVDIATLGIMGMG